MIEYIRCDRCGLKFLSVPITDDERPILCGQCVENANEEAYDRWQQGQL
jgi:formylmethanofuran dehydrogenase subunit E